MTREMQKHIKAKKERAAMLIRYANPKSRNKPTAEQVADALALHIPYAGTVRPEIMSFTATRYSRNDLIKSADFVLELSDGRTIRIDVYENLKDTRTPEEKEADRAATFPSGLFTIFHKDITPATEPEPKKEEVTKMTINDLANVHRSNIDNITGEEISHREKWGRVITALGYEDVKRCIPFSLDAIKEALPYDKHLNNLPLSWWDKAAGFIGAERGKAIHVGSPLNNLYRKHGITSYSPSDGVCILKEAARLWAEEV